MEEELFKLKNAHKCGICNYEANSKSSHMTKKHKHEILKNSMESENFLVPKPPSHQRHK